VVVADRSGSVVAFDRTGEVRWRYSSGSEVVGPIAVKGRTAFVSTGEGRRGSLLALDLSNGTTQWKHAFQSPLSGPTLVTNDIVFATSAGGLTVAADTLLVRAGTPDSSPGPELVAYRLGG
jgi:outer membrane protein assembly factor BamB